MASAMRPFTVSTAATCCNAENHLRFVIGRNIARNCLGNVYKVRKFIKVRDSRAAVVDDHTIRHSTISSSTSSFISIRKKRRTNPKFIVKIYERSIVVERLEKKTKKTAPRLRIEVKPTALPRSHALDSAAGLCLATPHDPPRYSQLMMSQRKRKRPSLSPYKKVVVDARVANTFCTDLWPWPMTLAFNPRRATVMTHTHAKIKVKGQLAQLVEWKQRRMDGHDRSHYFSRYRDRWILIDGRVLKGRTCTLSPKLAFTPGFAACQYSRSSVAMRRALTPVICSNNKKQTDNKLTRLRL